MKLTTNISVMARRASGGLVVAALVSLLALPALAQQHRATRLGHPATRFAPPLTEPEQLRTLLTDPKLHDDVVSILRQAGWTGNVDDLRRAATTAEITEVKLPTGTRLPFMSSRKEGKPVTLMDVLWAGAEPIEAYTFPFTSNGRRYRCVTPKPCSNFLVEDLGLEPPTLQLVKAAPAEASLCEPIPMSLTVRNTSGRTLTQVRVTDALPAGLRTAGNRTSLDLDAGDMKPGAGIQFTFTVMAAAAGTYVNTAQATCAEGAQAETSATTVVRAPALSLECQAPTNAALGRPFDLCLTVKNTGAVPEARTTLTLPIPDGVTVASATEEGKTSEGQVVWEIPNLAPQASQRVCVTLTARPSAALTFAPVARGVCAPEAKAECVTRVAGIPAILIEVVDLDDPIEVGKEVTYEISIVNQGSAPGTNIRLVGRLPELQEFVSGTGATAVRAQDRTITLEPLLMLEPKAEAKWRLVAKALKAGDARLKVELSSDQFQAPITEEEATQQY